MSGSQLDGDFSFSSRSPRSTSRRSIGYEEFALSADFDDGVEDLQGSDGSISESEARELWKQLSERIHQNMAGKNQLEIKAELHSTWSRASSSEDQVSTNLEPGGSDSSCQMSAEPGKDQGSFTDYWEEGVVDDELGNQHPSSQQTSIKSLNHGKEHSADIEPHITFWEKYTRRFSKSTRRSLLILGILVAAALVLSITLNIFSPKHSQTEKSISQSSTASPSSAPSSAPSTEDQGFQSAFYKALILDQNVTGVSDLDDPTSPSSRALRWMVRSNSTTDLQDWRYVQRFALAAFYFSCEGWNWTSQDGWLTEEDECTWFSQSNVTCDSGGSLIHLSLSSNNLKGILPSELGLLTKLEVLALEEQDIVGGLSNDLVRSWPNLAILDLRGNRLSGRLPRYLRDIRNLRHIDLMNNEFTGGVPSSYGFLKVTTLKLGNNRLEGSFPFGNLPNLEEMRLEQNMLTGISERMVAPRLERLIAHENRFSGTLPHFLSLRSLQTILLQGNMLVGYVPATWSGLSNLVRLDLSSNLLSGAIPSTLTGISSLKTLRLENNYFTSLSCTTERQSAWYADCMPVDGVVEIACPCCSHCCANGLGCHLQP